MRNTRVKVKREFLIEKIKEELAKEQKKYDDAVSVYASALEAQSVAVAAELRALADKIDLDPKNTTLYSRAEHYWRGDRIMISLETRAAVETPSDYEIKRLKKTIRVLEAATDDTISVSSMDDYYHFL